MKAKPLLAAGVVFFALSSPAQQPRKGIIAEGGGPDEQASARVLYWNRATDSSAGWFAINYGRPVWKKDYEDPAKFDPMTKGKVWRMGRNYWTALDTSLPLKISGKDVPVGYYYLGLRRSADGSQWSLAFIDPAKVRGTRLDAFEIGKAPVKFEAPMSASKSDAPTEKLTIALSYRKEDIKDVTMKLAWGSLALTAPIKVALPE